MWMQILGALGLFLLGMWMMTEGLKVAGGKALEHLLGQWICNRRRGFLTGVLVTGMVQSSSAVTVATIGFINAGLMTFSQSVWVIFGSNVGTTFTAWLVTIIGFKLDFTAITLPLIGIGAMMKVFSPRIRGQSLGMALAGFGLLFMGISSLQQSFSGIQIDPDSMMQLVNSPVLIGLTLGIALTIVTQSSSAALAIILTASATGITQLEMSAAAVIGANIGTTSTAIISGFGASSSAKRLVLAHILFNLLTGAVALLVLPMLMWSAEGYLTTHAGALPVILAVFHSGFNVLGVLLMLPLEPHLSKWLLKRFRGDRHRHSELDANIASMPELALGALFKQIRHLYYQILTLTITTAESEQKLSELSEKIRQAQEFISRASRNTLTEAQSTEFEIALDTLHGLSTAIQSYREFVQSNSDDKVLSFLPEIGIWLGNLQQYVSDKQQHNAEHWQQLNRDYQQLRLFMMRTCVARKLDLNRLERSLNGLSSILRFVRRLNEVKEQLQRHDEQEESWAKQQQPFILNQ